MQSGILLINKPAGTSSAKLIRKISRHFGWKKSGHGGTLDPFATGVLVMLVNEATKVSRFLLKGSKEYRAIARAGVATETGDLEGEIAATLPVPADLQERLENSRDSFCGNIQQTPPAYSAVKVNGKALYKYARKGQTVSAEPRTVRIDDLALESVSPTQFVFRVRCGGGTYIRKLAEDWATAAGTCAHLTALERVETCGFSVKNAIDAEELLAMPPEAAPLIPIADCLPELPQIAGTSLLCRQIQAGDQSQLDSHLFRVCDADQLQAEHLLLMTPDAPTRAPLALLSRTSESFRVDRVFHV